MRTLLAAHEPLTYDGIVAASSAVAGSDMSPYFARYVRGTDALPLSQCARDAGFTMLARDNDIYLSPNPAPATPTALAIRRSYLGER